MEEAVSELYGLPLPEFVAARDALAKRAKDHGSAKLAAHIKALRKPNVAAWLMNQVVRIRRADITELIAVGTQMRSATANLDGAQLRELTLRRNELVDTLLDHARQLAERADQQMSDETAHVLNETLLASAADPAAAAELEGGRLTRGLQHVGFGSVIDVDDKANVISLAHVRAARAPHPASAPQPPTQQARNVGGRPRRPEGPAQGLPRVDEKRRRAEHELYQAEAAIATTENRIENLLSEVHQRQAQLQTAKAAVERLMTELADARTQLAQARFDVKATQRQMDQARVAAGQARHRYRVAEQHLASLDE